MNYSIAMCVFGQLIYITICVFWQWIYFSDMIRQYNPDVRGYSLGTGQYWGKDAWLNQAIPGAIAEYVLNLFSY